MRIRREQITGKARRQLIIKIIAAYMRRTHGAVTNYLPVEGKSTPRSGNQFGLGFSCAYDNSLHRYLNAPFLGMHRCAYRFSLSFFLCSNAVLCQFGLALSLWLQRDSFFSQLRNARQESRQFLIFCMPLTWIYVSYTLAVEPSKVNLSSLLYLSHGTLNYYINNKEFPRRERVFRYN